MPDIQRISNDNSFIHHLMMEFVVNSSPVRGHNKTTTNLNEAMWTGLRRGLRLALAHWINDERRSLYAAYADEDDETNLKFYPSVNEHQTQELVNQAMKLATELKALDSAFLTALDELLDNWIWTEEISAEVQELRKKAILEGRIKPDASDRQWISELMKSQEDNLARLENLIGRSK